MKPVSRTTLPTRLARLARTIQKKPWNAPGTDKTNVIRSTWWALRLLRSIEHVER